MTGSGSLMLLVLLACSTASAYKHKIKASESTCLVGIDDRTMSRGVSTV